jgi:hypothetical protein
MESLGYLFGALFLFAGFGFSIVSFVRGCRKHSRRAKWLGGIGFLISTLVAVGVVVEGVFEGDLELNPWINNDAEIAGTWADHRVMLTLATNHTFNYHSSTGTVSGTWNRDDWHLYLNGSNFGATMRFVQFRGQYRLMNHLSMNHPIDPKIWDDLGLSRK